MIVELSPRYAFPTAQGGQTMKLFKPKTHLSEVCDQFYNQSIFHPTIAGIDPASEYCETVRGSIIDADRAFSSVGQKQFAEELKAIWFEVFGWRGSTS